MVLSRCTCNINGTYNLYVMSEVDVAIQQVSDSAEPIRLFLHNGMCIRCHNLQYRLKL